ncbi:MAG: hypothetical protein IT534_02155 [Bauldia sp.]|nr:hypothetical protein [Bauldia sp.]
MTTTFTEALDGLDARLAEAQKAAELLARSFKKLRKAAKDGQVGEIEKSLAALPEAAASAVRSVAGLDGVWSFDAKAWLADGYRAELLAAADAAGVRLIERDGRLYAFPLSLKLDPQTPAVRIGKKSERGIRPARIVAEIAKLQKRPPKLAEQKFLDLLFNAYRRVNRFDPAAIAAGPVTLLTELHALLTLLPGADYPIEEFGRDLLLLDRHPDLTAKGLRFEFVAAALARTAPRITVYSEDGAENVFIGIRFRREG